MGDKRQALLPSQILWGACPPWLSLRQPPVFSPVLLLKLKPPPHHSWYVGNAVV